MKCLSCGADASAHASICAQCGRRLARAGLMWRRCTHCGALVHVSRGVCTACGTPLARRRLRLWALMALAALALALLAWGARNAYLRLEASYLEAWPTALYEMSLADMATVTLAPLGPTNTPTKAAAVGGRSTGRPTIHASATSTATPPPTAAATATLTATKLATATPTMTTLATATPTATITPTATATPKATLAPTATNTLTAAPDTPIAVPKPAPATATPAALATALRYPAPVLLEPADGFVFAGGGTAVWLRWEAVGPLAADEFYAVSLRYQKDGGTAYSGTWYQGTEWQVPREVWQRYDAGHPEYYWDVVVMRQTGTREDGGRVGEPVGAVSAERMFIWR